MDKPPAVLLLDDDDDLLDALSDLVRLLVGARCLAVHSFGELVAQREPALACERAVLDINLGPAQPSGLDAYAWLKDQGFAGSVAFLTGHARSHPLVARACALGGVTVHQKPIGVDELRQMLTAPAARVSP
jgi:FixJ family two-component response regulator